MRQYVEQRDGGYWITGKSISLDSIVYAYRRGQSPESIRRSFPLLSLEEVYGAIAFYLENQAEIDDYLVREETDFETMRQKAQGADSDWYQKMQKAREELLSPHI
jgi:uncharacterized protein (DUF433 family)